MSEKITAIIDSNRILTISMSDSYTGEHNAQMLEIDIGPFAEGYDYYILNFDNYRFKGKIASNIIGTAEDSPAYIENGVIYCPLTSQLTCTGRLRVQLEAHKKTEDGEIVRKSSVASIEFKPSIMGDEDMLDSNSPVYGRIDELEDKVKSLEERPIGITEIPVAGEDKLGTVTYTHYSEVIADESGNMIINYKNLNSYRVTLHVVLSLFKTNNRVRCFNTDNADEASSSLLDYSLSVLNYECNKVLFVVWNDCIVSYFDESFEEKTVEIKKDTLYCYYLNDGAATITPYGGEEIRKLIVEGV